METITTPTLERASAEVGETISTDICGLLRELGESCRSTSKFYREALRAVAEHFSSPYAVIRVTHSASTLDEQFCPDPDSAGLWESATETLLLESHADNVPLARLYDVGCLDASENPSVQVAVLAVPICEKSNRPIGAISLIARCDDAPLAKAYLAELSGLVSLAATHASAIGCEGASNCEGEDTLKRAMVKGADFESLHELGFAVTNSLKNKLTCDQVTLAQVKRGRIHILSISGLDNVYPKSPGMKNIRQAMEECLDLGETICFQDEDKWADQPVSTNHRLHQRWHDEVGNAPVASMPLYVGDKCVAILSMSRSKQLPFSREELSTIREMVGPFAPALMLVAKAERSLPVHVTDRVRAGADWLVAPGTHGRKALAVAILIGAAYFCFAKIGYEVTVPSQIAPTEVLYFASPYEGTIKACYVEVGDEVVRGQPLYEMDTTNLSLVRDKLESDLAVLELKTNQALADEDVKSAALAEAEMRVVQAQLSITLHNLAQAQVRAPADGTVANGDLKKRIGEAVSMGEPLLEFVPKGQWSVELLVPEDTATDLKAGLAGRFACNARPGEPLRCTIVRIRPSSKPVEGKNVFVAEARVEGNPVWMRAGMEGVAKIEAGERPVWWAALHRIVDYLNLNFWL